MFYILWSLKEAYIKAIGQGLGYDLQQVRRSAVRFRLCSFVHHMGMMRGAFVDYSANVLLFVILVCCPQVEFEVAFEPEFGLNEKEHSMLKGGASVRVDGKLREDWR